MTKLCDGGLLASGNRSDNEYALPNLHGRAADDLDGLSNELAALQKRWNNRFTSKDFAVIGEAYASGRISLILEFKVAQSHAIAFDQSLYVPSGDSSGNFETVFAHLINNNCIGNFAHCDSGNDQIVFVDVIGFAGFPDRKIASAIRLYSGEDFKAYRGEFFHYSSIGWIGGSGFGRHEGLTQVIPEFVGREVYAHRLAGFGAHHPGGKIVEGCTKAVEGVTDRECHVNWNRSGNKLNVLFSELSVTLDNNFAKIGLGVSAEQMFNLTNVAVGPIDL